MEKGSVWVLVAILGFIFIIVVGFMSARLIIGGSEDNWICSKGQWVKHGNPSKPMPTNQCK